MGTGELYCYEDCGWGGGGGVKTGVVGVGELYCHEDRGGGGGCLLVFLI